MSRKFNILLSTILIIIVFTMPVLGAKKVLGLEDIMETALKNNIELDIAKLKLDNAKIDYKKNKLSNLSTKSRLIKLQGEVARMQAEQNFNNIKQNIVANILNKYLELVTVNNEIKVNKKEIKLEKRKIQEVKAQVETGYKGTLDLFAQKNDYQAVANDLERNLDKKKRILRLLKFKIGAGNDYNIKIVFLSRPKIWEIKEKEAVSKALKNSKSLKIAQKRVKLTEADYEKASVKNEALLNLQQKKNEFKLAKLNYKNEKHNLVERTLVLYADYKQSVNNMKLADNSLKQAEENYDIIVEQQKQGLVTDNNVLEAEVNMLKAGNSYLKSIINYYITRLNLKQGIGAEIEVNCYGNSNT